MDLEKTQGVAFGCVTGVAPHAAAAIHPRPWLSPWGPAKLLDSVLRGAAQVVFANNPTSGLLILIGLFVADVMTGLAAILCAVVAILVAKILNFPDEAISSGLTNFSPVLVGTVTASLYPVVFGRALDPRVWAFMVAAAALSVVVGGGLNHLLGSAHALPIFTLPFNIVTCLIFLGMRSAGYAATDNPDAAPAPFASNPINSTSFTENNLINRSLDGWELSGDGVTATTTAAETNVDIDWAQVWLGTLLSAGQVWAVQDVWCSVLVLAGMVFCSPLLTFACYLGGVLGTLTALAVSEAPWGAVYAGVWGYNGFLAAGALVFFMVPTPRVMLLAALNPVLACLVHAALLPVFDLTSMPVFTFPFCLASLLMLGTAIVTSPPSHRPAQLSTPEVHLLHFLKQHHNEDTDDEAHSV